MNKNNEMLNEFKEEDYMNSKTLSYFRLKLHNLKDEMLKKYEKVKNSLENYSNNTEVNDALMAAQKIEKYLKEVKAAIERIDDGVFGYCEETGEPIGIQRLEAQPTARYCVEAQEKLEKQKKIRNDEDNE